MSGYLSIEALTGVKEKSANQADVFGGLGNSVLPDRKYCLHQDNTYGQGAGGKTVHQENVSGSDFIGLV